MPWTLYRYILRDILKLLVLSTAVLVFIIGFAAAIKPLSDGLLGPAGLMKFVFFSMPTMLTLALPFAAAFASTMVFCRLTADNEIIACSSCGISYRTILLPILVLGLVLTLGLFFMSNWVIPRFYILAQEQLQQDMIKVLVSQVHKRQPVQLDDNTMLYADAADDTQTPPTIPGSTIQPTKLIILKGAAVGKFGEDGTIVREGTAEQADVYLFRERGQTWVSIRFRNVMMYDAESEKGHLAFLEHSDLAPIALPNPVRDRPRFMSWPELRELGREPERYDKVRERKATLAETIAGEQLLRMIETAVTGASTKGVMLRAAGEDQRYQVIAPTITREAHGLALSSTVASPVRVLFYSGGVRAREMQAKSGTITVDNDANEKEPRVRITLQNVVTTDLWTSRQGAERTNVSLPRVGWMDPLTGNLGELSIKELVKRGRGGFETSTPVQVDCDKLEYEIARLGRRIVVQLHERAAAAVSCALVLIFGATISMKMRGGMPLAVYFWSFMLALVAVIIGRTGGNLINDPEHGMALGLLVMWTGNILIGGIFTAVYLKLAKN